MIRDSKAQRAKIFQVRLHEEGFTWTELLAKIHKRECRKKDVLVKRIGSTKIGCYKVCL